MAILVLHPVLDAEQAERLRTVRNECRQFMTRDTSFVSPEQQTRWFASLDRARVHPYLLSSAETAAQLLGYGLIRLEGDTLLLSGGLLEKFRGQGIGMQLFALLIGKAREIGAVAIELEVLGNNARARRIYEKLGFESLASGEGVVRMRLA